MMSTILYSSKSLRLTTHPKYRMMFRWLFIPWLLQELDVYVDRMNNTRKRRDHNKVDNCGHSSFLFFFFFLFLESIFVRLGCSNPM